MALDIIIDPGDSKETSSVRSMGYFDAPASPEILGRICGNDYALRQLAFNLSPYGKDPKLEVKSAGYNLDKLYARLEAIPGKAEIIEFNQKEMLYTTSKLRNDSSSVSEFDKNISLRHALAASVATTNGFAVGVGFEITLQIGKFAPVSSEQTLSFDFEYNFSRTESKSSEISLESGLTGSVTLEPGQQAEITMSVRTGNIVAKVPFRVSLFGELDFYIGQKGKNQAFRYDHSIADLLKNLKAKNEAELETQVTTDNFWGIDAVVSSLETV